jgi:hypothetical protein
MRETTLKDPLRHLPFALVAFIVLLLGFVDLAVRVQASALVTVLAPVFWLGMYFLFGADRANQE